MIPPENENQQQPAPQTVINAEPEIISSSQVSQNQDTISPTLDDKTISQRSKWLGIAVVITVIICAFESLTKGWISLALIPASVVILPIFIGMQLFAIKQFRQSPSDLLLKVLQIGQILSLLVIYISLPAVGDTNETLLFGFLKGDINSTLANVSGVIAGVDFWVLIFISIVLLLRLVLFNKFGKKVFLACSALTLLVMIGVIANIYLNQQYWCNGYQVSKQSSLNCNKHGLSPIKKQN